MPQGQAVDEFHEEVIEIILLPEIVDRHNVRMAEHGHRPGFAGKTFGEGRVAGDRGREDLQRHEPIEAFLPGLVDHAHPALADELQDLQLRELSGQLFGRWRGEVAAWLGRLPEWQRGGFQAPLEQAAGTKPLGGVSRKRGSTFGTSIFFAHGTAPTRWSIYPYYKNLGGKVTAGSRNVANYKQVKR